MGIALEILGLGLIAGTVIAFIIPIAQKDPIGWPLFWGCAIGALGVIIYRKRQRKKAESN